jgi:hypothetical protein
MFLFFLFSQDLQYQNTKAPFFLDYKNVYISARITQTAYVIIAQPTDKKTPAYVGFYPLSSVDKSLSTTPKFFPSYSLPGIEHVKKITPLSAQGQPLSSKNSRDIASWSGLAGMQALNSAFNVISGQKTVGEGASGFLVGTAGAVAATLAFGSNPVGWALLGSAAVAYLGSYAASKVVNYYGVDQKIDTVLGTGKKGALAQESSLPTATSTNTATDPSKTELQPPKTEENSTNTKSNSEEVTQEPEEAPSGEDPKVRVDSLTTNPNVTSRATYSIAGCLFDRVSYPEGDLLITRICKNKQKVEECLQ